MVGLGPKKPPSRKGTGTLRINAHGDSFSSESRAHQVARFRSLVSLAHLNCLAVAGQAPASSDNTSSATQPVHIWPGPADKRLEIAHCGRGLVATKTCRPSFGCVSRANLASDITPSAAQVRRQNTLSRIRFHSYRFPLGLSGYAPRLV